VSARPLEGKVAIVTGGSGALGSAIVRAFARDGAHVAWTFVRDEARSQGVSEELAKADVRHLARKVDATDPAAMNDFVANVENELGPVDILVNNAGITQVMPLALIEVEDWDLVVDTNLRALFVATKAVTRSMMRRKTGRIVNVGSIGGERILDVPVHYAAVKAATSGFTKALSKELARHRILVNCIAPGLLDDGIGKNLAGERIEDYVAHANVGRRGTCAEVAECVAFVASDKCSYMSGQTLLIDGGL
jgi:NAD(P)-dependent dehydrogenase (short-subunit alcohol dehydrogenase family)